MEDLFKDVQKATELVGDKLQELKDKDTSNPEMSTVLVDKNVVDLNGIPSTFSSLETKRIISYVTKRTLHI